MSTVQVLTVRMWNQPMPLTRYQSFCGCQPMLTGHCALLAMASSPAVRGTTNAQSGVCAKGRQGGSGSCPPAAAYNHSARCSLLNIMRSSTIALAHDVLHTDLLMMKGMFDNWVATTAKNILPKTVQLKLCGDWPMTHLQAHQIRAGHVITASTAETYIQAYVPSRKKQTAS